MDKSQKNNHVKLASCGLWEDHDTGLSYHFEGRVCKGIFDKFIGNVLQERHNKRSYHDSENKTMQS